MILTMVACAGREPRAGTRAFDELIAIQLANRPIVPRLVGGFAYAPPAVPTRGASPAASVNLRLATVQLEKRLTQTRTAQTLAEYSAGALLTGQTTAAIETLNEARRAAPQSARILSDLAAAYLVRSSQSVTRPSQDQVQALELASLAIGREPSLGEAWFNRALSMEGIFPPAAVAAAWTDFLRVDGSTAWATEARERMPRPGPTLPLDFLSVPLADLPMLAARDTQQARELVLERLGPQWATASLEGRTRDAFAALERAEIIAEALVARTRDPLTARIVANMRSAQAGAQTAHDLLDFARGRQQYRSEQWRQAEDTFSRLHRRLPADNPLRCWTGLQLVTIAIDERKIPRARARLRAPEQQARRSGYRAAQGRALWLRGLIEHQSSQIDAALEDYRQAAAIFADIGERENELAVYNAGADNLRLRGERRQSWDYVLLVLGRSGDLTSALRRYLAFYNASLFAADEGWLHAALTFQDAAIRAAESAPSPGPRIEALTMKARLHLMIGDRGAADTDLSRAQTLLGDTGHDEYSARTIDAVLGEANATSYPALAEPALTRALSFFERAEPAQTVRLHLLRGRARLALGNPDGAEQDFWRGIGQVEHRRLGITNVQLRMAFLDDAADLFTEMAVLQIKVRDNPELAFDVTEQGRARALADTTGAPLLPLPEVQRTLPESVAVVEYKVLDDAVAVWTLTRTDVRFTLLPHRPENLVRLVNRYRASIDEVDQDAAHWNGRLLYDMLIAPIEDGIRGHHTVAIIPDGVLTRLPFGALIGPDGRYLIRRFALIAMPSATAFVAAGRRAASLTERPRTALLVGNPDIDRTRFPHLPPLPGAQAEVESLGRVYPYAVTLVASAATPSAFLRALPQADVVHFAGHAVENRDDPSLSALMLAPSADNPGGTLRARDIRHRLPTRTQLVVLAACDTADGPVSRGEGIHSLARPFLEAGVPNVVASLWTVDDSMAGALFEAVHTRIAAGVAPAEALRSAQLEALGKGGLRATPKAWAGFVILGAAGRE